MSLFLTSDAELRSGWRCAVYLAVLVILLFVTLTLLSLIVPEGDLSVQRIIALNSLALFPPAALTLWFMARQVDRLPIEVFGVGLHEGWIRDIGAGLLMAALMIGLFVGVGAVAGSFTAEVPEGEDTLSGILLIVLLLGLSAANEELIFRGYPLQVLMVGIGRGPAILVVSAVFGLGHHLNPGATWLGTANTFLAGILLCLAYLRTRSLWFPYGLHIGWNAGIGIVFGFPVSGVDFPSLLESELLGPAWITGGAFGPEGGILGTGVIIAAVVFMAGTGRWLGVSPRIQTLLDRHSTKIYNPTV